MQSQAGTTHSSGSIHQPSEHASLPSSLRSPSLRSLVVTNAILATVLVLVVLGATQSQHASAQPASVAAAGDRARGDYTMVSGRFREGSSNAIYIVDSSNQEVVAVRWDSSKQQMTGIGYRSIANDSRAARGR